MNLPPLELTDNTFKENHLLLQHIGSLIKENFPMALDIILMVALALLVSFQDPMEMALVLLEVSFLRVTYTNISNLEVSFLRGIMVVTIVPDIVQGRDLMEEMEAISIQEIIDGSLAHLVVIMEDFLDHLAVTKEVQPKITGMEIMVKSQISFQNVRFATKGVILLPIVITGMNKLILSMVVFHSAKSVANEDIQLLIVFIGETTFIKEINHLKPSLP